MHKKENGNDSFTAGFCNYVGGAQSRRRDNFRTKWIKVLSNGMIRTGS